nr:hypothetical protein [Flavisolibacter sp.]
MKKIIFITALLLNLNMFGQEVLKIQNGGSVSIQNGIELLLQGGITLDNGSSLLNNGTITLKNNTLANTSNWNDLSILGALTGTGVVIFNSTHAQQFAGTTSFFTVYINTKDLTINNNLHISNLLRLINGKINTANYVVALVNTAASSLENDISNNDYIASWINGNFKRTIATNTSSYDFPIGNTERSNLLKFVNNNITGTSELSVSFDPKPGTDAGLNVTENLNIYTAVNNGGVWKLVPNISATSGTYALHLYFNGFTGLTDNQFGILRRPDASSNAADWMVPAGSLLEPENGTGRKLSDGFARRYNISNFSQWGIGMTGFTSCEDCPSACTYTQGFYGNKNGQACYDNSGTTVSTTELMLNAFGATTSKVFGNVVNRRFFTLFKTDINNGNIFKMLPGSGNSKAIAVDNVLPYDGAYYDDPSTWPLVPISTKRNQKGKIGNQLLAQTITLWFNVRTSSSLGTIDLSMDTLLTSSQTHCGSVIISGNLSKFGIQHEVISYLNGGNGYSNNVNGLLQLANDILGGANTSLYPNNVKDAVEMLNRAFDGCRILTGTLPYVESELVTLQAASKTMVRETTAESFQVTAYPNPSTKNFTIAVQTDTKEKIMMQVVDILGRVIEIRNVTANSIITFGDAYRAGT